MAHVDDKSIDLATLEMLDKAAEDGVATAFDRAAAMRPCPIGGEGSCCRICSMGPCRLPAPRRREETAEEKDARRGVCGATIETVAARNFVRMIAGGAAAHSELGADGLRRQRLPARRALGLLLSGALSRADSAGAQSRRRFRTGRPRPPPQAEKASNRGESAPVVERRACPKRPG